MIPVLLDHLQFFDSPFAHFAVPNGMQYAFANQVLDWLETAAPWKLKIADFYEQHEFSLLDAVLPGELNVLTDHASQ